MGQLSNTERALCIAEGADSHTAAEPLTVAGQLKKLRQYCQARDTTVRSSIQQQEELQETHDERHPAWKQPWLWTYTDWH